MKGQGRAGGDHQGTASPSSQDFVKAAVSGTTNHASSANNWMRLDGSETAPSGAFSLGSRHSASGKGSREVCDLDGYLPAAGNNGLTGSRYAVVALGDHHVYGITSLSNSRMRSGDGGCHVALSKLRRAGQQATAGVIFRGVAAQCGGLALGCVMEALLPDVRGAQLAR